VTIGAGCVIGGNSAIAEHLELGAGSQVGGGAGITRSFPAKSRLGGHPARPVREWLRGAAEARGGAARGRARIRNLEERVRELERATKAAAARPT
jgi:UDP-3-O-[3-hydroxymyristoyl] glucosamine N-acyltransferase